jgi:hypothetical protein
MIAPGFAVLNRLLLQAGTICLLAGMIAVFVEISHLF